MDALLHSFSLAEIIGVAGFCLYVVNYSLLTLQVFSGRTITYFMINLCAASCVLVGLSSSFNLASALIQCFFILMSLIGILLRLSRRPAEQLGPV